jgi:O-antigen/teichoic acid export membrane protein
MSLRKNILSFGFFNVLRLVTAGFVASFILARWLGPANYGLYNILMIAPMILITFGELGVRQSTAFMIGKKLANESEIVRVVALLWILSSLFSVFLVFTTYYFQGLFNQNIVYLIAGMSLAPIGLITRYSNGIALGKQWISRINISGTVFIFVRCLLFVIVLIIFHYGIMGVLIVEIISSFIQGIIMLYWVKYDLCENLLPKWDSKIFSFLLIHGFKFALALFVISLNYKINLIILQRFVDDTSIGNFSLGVKIAELILMIPSAVGVVLFSHSTSDGDTKQFANTTAQVMRLTMYVCGFCALFIGIFCEPFVKILFGKEYLPSVPVIRMILPGVIAVAIFKILNANLTGRGYPLAAMWVYMGAIGVNVLFNFILIPIHGVIGSAEASTISYIFGAIIYAWVYARMSNLRLIEMFYQPAMDWKIFQSVVIKRRFF